MAGFLASAAGWGEDVLWPGASLAHGTGHRTQLPLCCLQSIPGSRGPSVGLQRGAASSLREKRRQEAGDGVYLGQG